MDLGNFSADTASRLVGWLWDSLLTVWLVLWFGRKRAKKFESPLKMAQHAFPVILGFWLVFENNWKGLHLRLLQEIPALWMLGLMLTALGLGTSIWARLTLGSNWSGVVTLKKDHELIRRGLYLWIRHPIYTGMLVAMIGTAMIKGHLRGGMGAAIVWGTFYFKARCEERLLRQEFGAGFEEHSRSTGMFFPKWT